MTRIKKFVAVLLVAGSLFFMGLFRSAAAAEYPQVTNLAPFTSEANYMSLVGYLRLLVYQQSGEWISIREAKHVVAEQEAQGT